MESFEHDLAILILSKPLRNTTFPEIGGSSMLRLETPLNIHYRSGIRRAVVTSIHGNINLYGAFPARVRPGDSGSPVYVNNELVALVAGYQRLGRARAMTDVLVPLDRAWISRHVRERAPTSPEL